MWDWDSGKWGYYADFLLVPLLMLAVLAIEIFYCDWDSMLLVTFTGGAVLWPFIEYWVHRELFHIVMRREHWLHHKRPRGYVTVPSWATMPVHVLLYGALVGSLGMVKGTGLFLGLEASYLWYIVVHDRIHHGPRKSTYIRRRAALHDVHHTYGSEMNFGSSFSLWDRVFGTHQEPAMGHLTSDSE